LASIDAKLKQPLQQRPQRLNSAKLGLSTFGQQAEQSTDEATTNAAIEEAADEPHHSLAAEQRLKADIRGIHSISARKPANDPSDGAGATFSTERFGHDRTENDPADTV
jgi:hypothetical protein